MRSPFTNGNVQLKSEQRELVFRKEKYSIYYHYYICEDSKEQFTTDELDNLNIVQVHNKYREHFGIPFTEEIINIRKQYGLSAAKMSEVLGLGPNSYRNYESGEVPSVASGRLIRLSEDPNEFLKLLEMSKNTFDAHQYESVLKKVYAAQKAKDNFLSCWEDWLFGEVYPSVFNGYKKPDLSKVGNMVSFFADQMKPFTTALNKLLFYADFGHFKRYGFSISGLSYKAIKHGPVPENYGSIYDITVNSGYVKVEEYNFGDYVGEQFVNLKKENNYSALTELEYDTLLSVAKTFKGLSTREFVNLSHDEIAWNNNHADKSRISYEHSFELIHFK